ncbi:MAG TPA: DUF3093 domain-containing protein [Arachnia sp.]|nr:DUF3093 domain-containing protein [Arachnia sp.]
MTYRERLYIPWWWVVIALLFWLSLAVAVLAYIPAGPAIAFSVLAAVGMGLALVAYSLTLVGVDGDTLTAGRCRVAGEYISGVSPLSGEAARIATGPGADHRAFLFTRPFVPGLVRVDLADPADPHPYWLVSTRRPEELAAAIDAVRGRR